MNRSQSNRLSRREFVGSSIAASLAVGTAIPGLAAMQAAPRKYKIESIDLFVRMTPKGRLAVAIGKGSGKKSKPERNALAHVRVVISDDRGNRTFGASGDRMSVRWLDKRPGRSKTKKLTELVTLLEKGRDIYLRNAEFTSPFAMWLVCYKQIHAAGHAMDQEDLTSAFSSAILERAMLDAVCRLNQKSMFQMLKEDLLGFRPDIVLPELKGFSLAESLPSKPRTILATRHMVSKTDPLTAADLGPGDKINDGLPQTLEEVIRFYGNTMFKLKSSGDVAFDLNRMANIWKVLPDGEDTLITIDANEAYSNLDHFEAFVDGMQRNIPGFFKRLAYIEQPLTRALTLDLKTKDRIDRINAKKKLIIDEADGVLTAFQQAREIGYIGCSHKNCKGFFKSLLNLATVNYYKARGENLLISAEDLQNMPIVPLQQDFCAVSSLGVTNCERNGHHFNFGLSMVSPEERKLAEKYHSDMYVRRGDELFLNIQDGKVDVGSLQCPGFGIRFEPDWDSMEPMRKWLDARNAKES